LEISKQVVSLLYQITTMKALPNNNKPATHFIEVYRHKNFQYGFRNTRCLSANFMQRALEKTKEVGLITIAIFKIRLK
jgi:hypothetical protein